MSTRPGARRFGEYTNEETKNGDDFVVSDALLRPEADGDARGGTAVSIDDLLGSCGVGDQPW